MSRQEVEFKVVGTDKDTGEEDVSAIKPVADGEPGQAAVFKRPSENLRTRTEVIRDELENLKFLSDADRAMLLSCGGTVTWNGLPTGTFTASADITLKPFTAPSASTASRLLIGATTASQITIRTRQDGVAGQPRAYSGANAISFDFTPVDTGTGVVVITVDGTPADNFHVQYDSNIVSGTTVQQMMDYLNNVTPTAGGAAFVAAGLEAVVDNTLGPNGGPLEVGFPTPPAPVVGNKVICSGPEQLLRFMAGAADAEKHIITPAHLTTFFADPLNVLVEGDVLCVRYDDLVMIGDGGRRQSIDEFPEDKADDAGANLFLMRRFPERLPGALPFATVAEGFLIFVNNRVFYSGEVGPPMASDSFYQGSPAAPNSWADGTTVAGPTFLENALDTVIQTLGTKTGVTPGAIKIGFTPSGNIAANTVKDALEELDSEKAGLALANTFTRANTFTASVAAETAITATGNTTGEGVKGTGGTSNGAGVHGKGGATNGDGTWGEGTGTGSGVKGDGGASAGPGVSGTGGAGGTGGVFNGGTGNSKGIEARAKGTESNSLYADGTGIALSVLGSATTTTQPAGKIFANAAHGGLYVEGQGGYGLQVADVSGGGSRVIEIVAGDANNIPLQINPKANTWQYLGGVGMETYTAGTTGTASGATRLTTGHTVTARTNVKTALSMNAGGSIFPALSFLDYWVTSDGLLYFEAQDNAGGYNITDTVINSNAQSTTIGTFPVDYRPLVNQWFPLHVTWAGQTDGSPGWYLKVLTDGTFVIDNQSGTSRTITFVFFNLKGYYPLF
jgi:hypothetical protein